MLLQPVSEQSFYGKTALSILSVIAMKKSGALFIGALKMRRKVHIMPEGHIIHVSDYHPFRKERISLRKPRFRLGAPEKPRPSAEPFWGKGGARKRADDAF